MQIIIPGRPQSLERDHTGRLLDAARAYLDAVRTAVAATAVTPADGPVRLDVHLIYTSRQPLAIRVWPLASIPNGDVAPKLVLKALTGTLVHHRGQFNPLTITRTMLAADECREQHGHPDGATILTWEEH